MLSPEAQLEALLDIITTSAHHAIAEYKKGGNEVPTIHSKTFHPIDSATDNVALKKAVRLLEGACQQLCASLAPPQHTLHNSVMSFDWACLDVVLRAKVADALEIYPDGLHIDELARHVHLEKGKLARILRLLATKGCFIEVEPDTFANNRISLITLSSSCSGILCRCQSYYTSHGALALYETLTKPECATSYAPEKSAFMHALARQGFKGSFFDWLTEDDEKREDFHRSMIGLGDVMGSLSVLHHYPWSEVKTVCDVGGSIGTATLPLLKMYPHLKIVDQDLPSVLVQAKEVWARDAPEALENNQVEFVPFNFFEESPVKNQDVYYLRNIIHDWPDEKAIVILKHVRNAMAPHSRLLIHDYVLSPPIHHPDRETTTLNTVIAPEPMLPNFGDGNHRMYQQDLGMLIMVNGKERTLEESVALGSAAGLRLEKMYDLAETAVLEFRTDVRDLTSDDSKRTTMRASE